MSSHNTKADFAFHNPSTEAAKENCKAPDQRVPLANDSSLAVDEDFDLGCDPYNATGQHVIIKPKIPKYD